MSRRGSRRGRGRGRGGGRGGAGARSRTAPATAPGEAGGRIDPGRLLGGILLWLLPALVVWLLATPFYNRFLIASGETLVHLAEAGSPTDLMPRDRHYAIVARRDFPPASSNVYSFRVTDLHFHLVLLAALFLAVPGVPWRLRLERLGWALLASVFFHLLLVLLWVKFAYATQLGAWSAEHYGAFARNAWGLAKHLADLPVKLAWPLALWAAVYLGRLTGERVR